MSYCRSPRADGEIATERCVPAMVTLLRRFCALLCLLLVVAPAVAVGSEPQEEARALWVVRHDMYTKSNIDFMFNLSKTMGANMLIVQVTSSGETVVRSELYPRARQVPADFDPLAYLIEIAHAEGIEVHAWINAFVLSGFSTRPQDPLHIVNARPELITYTADGRSLVDLMGLLAANIPSDLPGLMLEPTLPEVRALVASHAAEIARNYDVDGIHLDYIRYAGRGYGYNPETRAAFQAEYGYDPIDFAPPNAVAFAEEHGFALQAQLERAWDDYRREAVTQTIIDVYEAVTAEKPWVVVSAAVFANQSDAFQYRFQDWTKWLREGLIDLVIPMAYGTNPLVVRQQIMVATQSAQVGGRHVLAGLGIYNIGADRPTLTTMVEDSRELGTQGFALFSYQSIVGNLNTFMMVRDMFGQGERPTVPAMPWKPERPY